LAATICALAASTAAFARRVARKMRWWPTSCATVQSPPGPVLPGGPTAATAFAAKAAS
jgi:hypothetical protein